MKKPALLFALLALAALAPLSAKAQDISESASGSLTDGLGGAPQAETSPIAYPPEMTDEPVPVYTTPAAAVATATNSAVGAEKHEAPPIVVNQIVIPHPLAERNEELHEREKPKGGTGITESQPYDTGLSGTAARVIEENRERINTLSQKRIEEVRTLQGKPSADPDTATHKAKPSKPAADGGKDKDGSSD